jgi:uncharacterized protein
MIVMVTQASPSTSDYAHLPDAFHLMTKPGGAICNLDCDYCYFLSKEMLYPGSRFKMAYELLDTYVRQYIEAQQVPEVNFAWQGGEPTRLGLAFYQQAVELQKKYVRPGMRVHNSMQTNGTLLDDDWCAFFKENDFLIGLSIDGPQALHDAYRVDKGGKGSFERVMKGLELLHKHGVSFNVLTTVHAANALHGQKVYRFLRDEVGAQFIQFIPIVERDNTTGFQEGTEVTKRSVTGKQYGQFMIEVFDEWVYQDVGRVYVQLFDVSLAAWLGERPGLCVFEETCGKALALEHNGDVYSCDHYVEPAHHLGNLVELPLIDMVVSDQQLAFGEAKRTTLPRYCRACEVRFVCNGGCPKDRVLTTPDGEAGLNYLCEGYKTFFTYIDPYMKFMANEIRFQRAPANIMPSLRQRDLRIKEQLNKLSRNDLCPCGSGKKVKHCHGRRL